MIKRKPELAKWRGGMPGGLNNALGARAMYLYNKGGDTGYRLHGTPEWWSIGKAMSSGCIRLINQDIIDLYSRVDNRRQGHREIAVAKARTQAAGGRCGGKRAGRKRPALFCLIAEAPCRNRRWPRRIKDAGARTLPLHSGG
jgi:hypothetical protein